MERLGIRHTDRAIELLSEGIFIMAFQPIVETLTEKILGFEALMRGSWLSPIGSPEELFGETGCQADLLRLDMACIGSALRCGRALASNYQLFINAHSVTLRELSMNLNAFLKLLDELGINANRIVFEISEKTDHACASAIRGYMGEFLKCGIGIAIDDVGASFKWLHHMRCVEPKFIKIDKSFVMEMDRWKTKQTLVQSLALMTRRMGIHIIAEGVERPQELRILREYGIAFGQGYFLGRPYPAEQWLDALDKRMLLKEDMSETYDRGRPNVSGGDWNE